MLSTEKKLVLFTFFIALTACSSIEDKYFHFEEHYTERLHKREKGNIVVEAAALSNDESMSHFGFPLNEINIQPVFIRIQNKDDSPNLLFPIASDPDYYPPYEIARRVNKLSSISIEEMYSRLSSELITNTVPPHSTREGFIFTHADEGMKSFWVEIRGIHTTSNFHFVVPVPGLPSTYFDVDDDVLSEHQYTTELNKSQLKTYLESLPCCTRNLENVRGDPVNIAFVGTLDEVRGALIGRNWDVTAPVSKASVMRMISAFVFEALYRYSPISPLFYFDREHDLAFQKARALIDERIHLRLWLAPVKYEGRPLWIGQISRDVGVKLSGRLWPPTTHIIDPDVDDARFYLMQDIMESKRLKAFGYVNSFTPSTIATPSYNAENDPFFTDGMRVLMVLTEESAYSAYSELWQWEYPEKIKPFAEVLFPRDASEDVEVLEINQNETPDIVPES